MNYNEDDFMVYDEYEMPVKRNKLKKLTLDEKKEKLFGDDAYLIYINSMWYKQ